MMPRFTTSSRTGSTRGPALLAPSPETSITCRCEEMLFFAISSVARISAVEIEVRCSPKIVFLVKPVGEVVGRLLAVDDGPRDGDVGIEIARPFHVDDGDLALGPRHQGVDHVLVAEGVDIAVALQFVLVLVHGLGDIDGEDQFEVDPPHGCALLRRDGRGKAEKPRQRQGGGGPQTGFRASSKAPAREQPSLQANLAAGKLGYITNSRPRGLSGDRISKTRSGLDDGRSA